MSDAMADAVALVRRIAALGTCDDPGARCFHDSGPYCQTHPHCLDDEVNEARRVLAALDATAVDNGRGQKPDGRHDG